MQAESLDDEENEENVNKKDQGDNNKRALEKDELKHQDFITSKHQPTPEELQNQVVIRIAEAKEKEKKHLATAATLEALGKCKDVSLVVLGEAVLNEAEDKKAAQEAELKKQQAQARLKMENKKMAAALAEAKSVEALQERENKVKATIAAAERDLQTLLNNPKRDDKAYLEELAIRKKQLQVYQNNREEVEKALRRAKLNEGIATCWAFTKAFTLWWGPIALELVVLIIELTALVRPGNAWNADALLREVAAMLSISVCVNLYWIVALDGKDSKEFWENREKEAIPYHQGWLNFGGLIVACIAIKRGDPALPEFIASVVVSSIGILLFLRKLYFSDISPEDGSYIIVVAILAELVAFAVLSLIYINWVFSLMLFLLLIIPLCAIVAFKQDPDESDCILFFSGCSCILFLCIFFAIPSVREKVLAFPLVL